MSHTHHRAVKFTSMLLGACIVSATAASAQSTPVRVPTRARPPIAIPKRTSIATGGTTNPPPAPLPLTESLQVSTDGVHWGPQVTLPYQSTPTVTLFLRWNPTVPVNYLDGRSDVGYYALQSVDTYNSLCAWVVSGTVLRIPGAASTSQWKGVMGWPPNVYNSFTCHYVLTALLNLPGGDQAQLPIASNDIAVNITK